MTLHCRGNGRRPVHIRLILRLGHSECRALSLPHHARCVGVSLDISLVLSILESLYLAHALSHTIKPLSLSLSLSLADVLYLSR